MISAQLSIAFILHVAAQIAARLSGQDQARAMGAAR
jgi:hypothetical protein